MRTRFAPSPTGFLHIGGLRTALYAYLVAKQSGGSFILRIEDTDQTRAVDGATENILRTLEWAGLRPDEGVILQDGQINQTGSHGPYIQSQRTEMYREHAQKLIDAGHAYYAFDTKEDLDRMREEENKAGNPAPKYDSSVRMRMVNSLTLTPEEVDQKIKDGVPYAIRMKVPDGNVVRFNDDVRGKVEFKGIDIDDQILLKSDGFPTYHLANVVDDHFMDINLVIRGEEWLSSTPKHLLLFEFFGWDAPRYAHVPLLLNKDKSKLSKRQNDVAAEDYMTKGYLPESVINFLAFLGWNPGTTEEFFSLEDLVEQFDLSRVQKGGAVFDPERLDWFQGQWIRRLPTEEFAKRIHPLVIDAYPLAKDDENFAEKASLIQERITFFPEAPEMLSYYYVEPKVDRELMANKKQKVTTDMLPSVLSLLQETLNSVEDANWNEEHLKEILFAIADKKELKKGQVLWPLRALLTGLPFSPGAFEVAAILGKEKTMQRIGAAINDL